MLGAFTLGMFVPWTNSWVCLSLTLTDLSYVWIAKFRVTIIFLGSFCWHLREPDLYHVDWLRANCGQV